MPANYFDERVAAGYDGGSPEMFDTAVLDPTVSFLAGLARGGAALEFAIGTGRVALPLSQRGVPVRGIDLSPQMVERLRGKPGAEAIEVAIGDMATTRVEGAFRVVYLVYNSILNLTSQDEQVECFRNAAAHLVRGGSFVVEAIVPALQRLPHGETVRPFDVTRAHVGLDEYDVVTQAAVSHHYHARPDGKYVLWSMPWRYAWPCELDLMARIAGMRLRERWGGWQRQPFTKDSTSHVSVWEKL